MLEGTPLPGDRWELGRCPGAPTYRFGSALTVSLTKERAHEPTSTRIGVRLQPGITSSAALARPGRWPFRASLLWRPDVLLRCLLFAGVAAACSVAWPATARGSADGVAQREPHATAVLYTAGPGSDLFSLWGHSGLCIRSALSPEGRCYDFGASPERDPMKLSLGTLRGERLFVPIALPEPQFVERYAERDLWRQDLPLPAASVAPLQTLLEEKIRRGEGYAYQPFFDNCSTRLRDLLDHASAGQLRAHADTPDGPPLRRFAEEGLSGQVLPLGLVALAVGPRADEPTSAWQRMAFPLELREYIAHSLSAQPVLVTTRITPPLPTSPAAGRLALLALSIVAALAVLRSKKRPKLHGALVRVWGALLGATALLILWSSRTALPELQDTWATLLLLPTDWIIALGPARWWRPYAAGRLACAALLLLVAAFTVTLPSLLWVAPLVVLPFGALLRRLSPNSASLRADWGPGPGAERTRASRGRG